MMFELSSDHSNVRTFRPYLNVLTDSTWQACEKAGTVSNLSTWFMTTFDLTWHASFLHVELDGLKQKSLHPLRDEGSAPRYHPDYVSKLLIFASAPT